jgi:hypothetical protein
VNKECGEEQSGTTKCLSVSDTATEIKIIKSEWLGHVNLMEDARIREMTFNTKQEVTTKVALGQVFSENFDFPCQPTFHLLLHNHLHYHPRLAQ